MISDGDNHGQKDPNMMNHPRIAKVAVTQKFLDSKQGSKPLAEHDVNGKKRAIGRSI